MRQQMFQNLCNEFGWVLTPPLVFKIPRSQDLLVGQDPGVLKDSWCIWEWIILWNAWTYVCRILKEWGAHLCCAHQPAVWWPLCFLFFHMILISSPFFPHRGVYVGNQGSPRKLSAARKPRLLSSPWWRPTRSTAGCPRLCLTAECLAADPATRLAGQMPASPNTQSNTPR